MHQAHGRHDNAPKHHNRRNEHRRLQALEQDVGEGFKAGVRDEEERESGVVLATAHVEVVDEAVDFGVADVSSIEEGDEVEEGQPGDDFDVQAADELLVLWRVIVSYAAMGLSKIGEWFTIAAFSSSLFPASGSGKRSSPSPCSACLAC